MTWHSDHSWWRPVNSLWVRQCSSHLWSALTHCTLVTHCVTAPPPHPHCQWLTPPTDHWSSDTLHSAPRLSWSQIGWTCQIIRITGHTGIIRDSAAEQIGLIWDTDLWSTRVIKQWDLIDTNLTQLVTRIWTMNSTYHIQNSLNATNSKIELILDISNTLNLDNLEHDWLTEFYSLIFRWFDCSIWLKFNSFFSFFLLKQM